MRVYLLHAFLELNKTINFTVVCQDVNEAQTLFDSFMTENYPLYKSSDLSITDLTPTLNNNGFYYKGNNK